jgi:hypothetical protein
MMDESPAAAVEVFGRDRGGSRASECHSQGLMSWQQALRTYRGTLELLLIPTSLGSLRPGWPTFSAPPEPVQVEVGM